ncbi:MAG: general secretion pathway protein GspK [Elusimicrobia bacterium]|nr:general secretion pathway protein GspK [Elusimicrobiota bacterium]
MDESSRINLNTASTDTLRRLLGSDTAAAGVGDWRDADDRPRFDGAEKTYYASLGRVPCHYGPLAAVENFADQGVTPALYERVKAGHRLGRREDQPQHRFVRHVAGSGFLRRDG